MITYDIPMYYKRYLKDEKNGIKYLNLTEGALVKIKAPIEYLKRLEFHNNLKDYKDYFF